MPAVAEVQFKATNSQTVVTAFNSIGTAAGNAGTKVQQFTAGATTKIQQFTSSLNSIKTQGNPLSNLSTNLTDFNKSVDQSSQKVTTFGQKLKGFGSQFGSSIASIGALGGTLVGLTRQYQDLGDSQIAVDKAQLKVSRTTEAVGTAQGKLNDLTAKGVTSGAEYNKALLDVNQAMEAQSLAEQMLTERQEDHQRAQENFWITLVPTVTTAGASIISVLNDIGGTKGLGGLKTALSGLKTAFTGFTGIGGIATGLAGIGTAASGSVTGLNGMTTATTGLGTAMKGLALSSLPVAVAVGGVALIAKSAGLVIHEIVSIMKGDMLEAVKSMENMISLVEKVGPALGPFGGIQTSIFTQLRPEIEKFRAELEKVPPVIKPIPAELQTMDDIAQGVNGTIDSLVGGVLGLVRKAEAAPKPLNDTGAAIDGVGTAASGAEPPVATLTTSLDTLSGSFATITKNMETFAVPFATLTAQTDPFNAGAVLAAKNLAAENSELSLLTKSAMAGAKASGAMTAEQNRLAAVLAKATQNMQKQAKVSQDLFGHGAGLDFSGGQPQPTRTGARVSGARNPNFRLRSDYQKATITGRQHGYQGTIKRPTMFIAGEGGRPEDVTVRPRGSVQRGGSGGGGFNGIVNVYVDGVLRPARYDMGARK